MFNYAAFDGSDQGDYLGVELSQTEKGYVGVYYIHSNLEDKYVKFFQTCVRQTEEEDVHPYPEPEAPPDLPGLPPVLVALMCVLLLIMYFLIEIFL